jgi:hypothetical protein
VFVAGLHGADDAEHCDDEYEVVDGADDVGHPYADNLLGLVGPLPDDFHPDRKRSGAGQYERNDLPNLTLLL